MPSIDAYDDPATQRSKNRRQLVMDILRGVTAIPETALTMGTGALDMAGTGLGVGAGALQTGDWETAAETINDRLGRATYKPRDETARMNLEGVGQVVGAAEKGINAIPRTVLRGGLTAQEQRSPAGKEALRTTEDLGDYAVKYGGPGLATLGYTALSMGDPEIAFPTSAVTSALRKGASIARKGAETAVPIGKSLAHIPKGQRGAWTMEDLTGTPGDFEMRSPLVEAVNQLRPQERKAKGKQMLRALVTRGPKGTANELKESGLADILDTDVPVTAEDVLEYHNSFGVQLGLERKGKPGFDPSNVQPITPEMIQQEAERQLQLNSSQLTYPVNVTVDGQPVGTFPNIHEARGAMRQMRTDQYQARRRELTDDPTLAFDQAEIDRLTAAGDLVDAIDNKAYDEIYGKDWQTRHDTSQPATNRDYLLETFRQHIAADPDRYGIGGRTRPVGPEYSQYTITSPSNAPHPKGTDYGETLHVLKREGRYGRGIDPGAAQKVEANAQTPFQQALAEALRARFANPQAEHIRQTPFQHSHWGSNPNVMVHSRNETWPAPLESTNPGTTRMNIETQSDIAQQGRKEKHGFYDPEAMANEQATLAAQKAAGIDSAYQQTLDLIRKLKPSERKYAISGLGKATLKELRASLKNAYDASKQAVLPGMGGNPVDTAIRYFQDVANQIYYSLPYDREALAEPLRKHMQTISQSASQRRRLQPHSPMPIVGDSRKVLELAALQQITDAVRGGHQHVGFSRGYTHAPERWTSEELSWYPDPAHPGDPNKLIVATGASPAGGGLRGEAWQEKVRTLRRGERPSQSSVWNDPYPTTYPIDLSNPNAEQDMRNIVVSHLSSEAGQYEDSQKFLTDRANKILENMRKAGEGHYAPRSHGMNVAYDEVQASVVQDILRRHGSTGSGKGVQRGVEAPIGRPMAFVYDATKDDWRPRALNDQSEVDQYRSLAASQPDKYRFVPATMNAVEIDPELARAAKKGFLQPY